MVALIESIRSALRALWSSKLRAGLTLLIIAFGIMALVGILTAIDSILGSLGDSFSTLGANSFSIAPRGAELGGRRAGRQIRRGDAITLDQALDFQQRFDYGARVTVSLFGTGNAEIKSGDKKTNPTVQVVGVDEDYLYVKGYDIEYGRNLTPIEVSGGYPVAIIGMDIVKTLFNDQPEKALQSSVLVGNRRFRINGILKPKGSSINQAGDRVVLIPLQAAREMYSARRNNVALDVAVLNAAEIDDAIDAATGLFRTIRRLSLREENDFEIYKSDGLISLIKENTLQLRMAAVGIGIITLLGAAIGLMNIMLVSVAERTREIGVIKALGARNRDVMFQFLTEAVVLCQLGGVLGIILGILAGNVVSLLVGSTFIIPWAWILLGITVCTLVGLLAGIYPAAKASRMDPIESLRYE
jgi:putative ABC transport system permease protein